jgi:hypothetical protein
VASAELFGRVVAAAQLDDTWLAPGATLTEQRDLVLAGLADRLHDGSATA